MSNLLVEIYPEHENVVVNKFTKDNVETVFRHQVAYVDFGGKFPVEFKVNLRDGDEHYQAGKYKLAPCSFAVNARGNLEFSAYNIKLDKIGVK